MAPIKRPAAAAGTANKREEAALKRPAAAREAEDEHEAATEAGSEDEGKEEQPPPKRGQAESKTAREKKREADKQRRIVQRLLGEKEKLQKKLRLNSTCLRAAEKILEDLDDVAKSAQRKANTIKNKISREKAEIRANRDRIRAAKMRKRAAAKAARDERLIKKANKAIRLARGRSKDFDDTFQEAQRKLNAAQSKFDELTQRCKQLKAKGEEVPDSDDDSWDKVAKAAWKPPGVTASRDRKAAREALAKARAHFKKIAEEKGTRDEKLQAAKGKLSAIVNPKAEEGSDEESDSSPAAATPKAKGKAMAKVKTVKKHRLKVTMKKAKSKGKGKK